MEDPRLMAVRNVGTPDASDYPTVCALIYVGDQLARIADTLQEGTKKGGPLDLRDIVNQLRQLR